MNLRFFGLLVAMGLVVAACGAESAVDTENTAAAPTDLAMTDLLEIAQEVTTNNEPLDDLCRRLYGDVIIDVELTVGLVADVGSIDDGTFNQAAFEGMDAAGRCLGVTTTFLESAGDDAAEEIASMVDRDVDIVVTVGFQFQEATVAAALARPDVRFIGVDQGNPDEIGNYVAISFRDDQVGFLAGAMAALLSESKTVAVIAGPDTVPPVVAIADGFEAGAQHISDEVAVVREHVGSFTDSSAGAQLAATFVEAGADVVFGAAGDTGTGATLTASAMGAWVIGVDQDEYFTTFAGGAEPSSHRLSTSAIKRVDLGVFLTIAAMGTGEVEGGGLLLEAANGGVTYAPFHEADIPAEAAEALEQVRLGLASGELAAG
jgi:basic membrane protein A